MKAGGRFAVAVLTIALAAPGLPGKSAPCAAASHIRDTIYAVIREREEKHER